MDLGTARDAPKPPQLLADLRADGGLQNGACVTDDLTVTELLDPTSALNPGQGRYYLVRGQNTCPGGTGTFGSANRDTTHDLSGSKCN